MRYMQEVRITIIEIAKYNVMQYNIGFKAKCRDEMQAPEQTNLVPYRSTLYSTLCHIDLLTLILISLSPTTSPTSPTPATCICTCMYGISAASDPCSTLKLPPPL